MFWASMFLKRPCLPVYLRTDPNAVNAQRLKQHDGDHDRAINDKLDVGYPGDGKKAFGKGLQPYAQIWDAENVPKFQIQPGKQAGSRNGTKDRA